ncbi:MAG: sulfotransferase family 2 domain-containing protein [Acidimicrobiales bacterium]|nr:sulfotransferase family 2 domain-containing protein [Acidimicrobiales bacterium]
MTVLFLHIPKAAGTSYGAALATALGGPAYFPDIPGGITSEEFQQVDVDSLREFSFVGAHVDYGLCRRAPFLRPVTVLRDPVDRIVSWYHYVLNDDGPSLAEWRDFIHARRLSVEEFLLHPQLRWLQGQAQTMQIAGHLWSGDPLPFVDDFVPIAAENLSGFTHVGLFERLGDSMRLAQAELGLADVPTLPDRNVSPERPTPLDPEVRAEVAGLIGMDAAFYPLAVAEFERRLAAHGLADDRVDLPPPVRPAAIVAPPAPAAPAAGPTDTAAGVGDWVELAWAPEPGTSLSGPLIWPLPLTAPEEATTASVGGSLVTGDPAPVDIGANWVRVAAGLYHVQATVPCRRFDHDDDGEEWQLLFDFAWYADPPIPFAEGLPGMPDLVLWLAQAVPAGLPKLPLRGAPVTAGGLLRVPRDGGHVCFLLGSNRPVVMSPGDEVLLRYAKVG